MILACMIGLDEDALICDFAETYRIYDYRQLPARRAAVYACGLRPNARIMMKLAGAKVPLETILLGLIADAEAIGVWMQTEDGVNGTNRPVSIMEAMLGIQKETVSFESPEAFMEWRAKMLEG